MNIYTYNYVSSSGILIWGFHVVPPSRSLRWHRASGAPVCPWACYPFMHRSKDKGV